MKHTLGMRFFSILLALLTLGTAMPILPLAADGGLAYTTDVTYPGPDRHARICGGSNGVQAAGDLDVFAMQFVLTAPARAVSTDLPSYSNDTGSVTMALFAFDTDYDTTLLCDPLAEHTFVDFPDGGDLAFVFGEDAPLPAGEYLLVLYDLYDPTPSADGGAGAGIGMWVCTPHEGQRAYTNGSFVADRSFPVSVDYVTVPESLYGIPTKPAVSGDVDYAPHMGAVLDFRNEATMERLGGGNMTTASFETEDGVSFLRLKASTDAGDPFQGISFPDTLIKCNEYRYALLKVRRTEGSNRQAQLFFTTDEQGISEAASVRPTYGDTTDWQYVVVNLGANNCYSGQLKSFRLDYFQSSPGSHHLDLQYIALFKSAEAAEAFHDNFEDFENTSSGGDTDPDVEIDYSDYVTADTPADPVAGKLTPNGQLNYIYKDYPYLMDFEGKTPADYVSEGGFAFVAIDNALAVDGVLKCKAFSAYEIYTKRFLGDAYGLRGGSLSFDMALERGEVTVTLRQMRPNDDPERSGICFTITAEGTVTVTERDGLTDTFKLADSLAEARSYVFSDKGSALTLSVDGEEVYALEWDSTTGLLTTPEGKTFASTHLPGAGYAALQVTRARGYLDRVAYTYTDVLPKTPASRPVDYTTWVATDDLGRTTPTFTEVGEGKDKYVGIFYFMIHSDDMGSRYVNDVTRFYLEGGVENVSAKLSSFAGRNGAYWAEPYFGYYSSHDTWVYRKHAYMLEAAGVDFIFLDVSNNRFYEEQCHVLFRTWKEIRDAGGSTPQIAFMYGDMPFTLLNGLYTLLEPFYNNPDYADLLFTWEGKPLLLGNSDTPEDRLWTVSDTTPQSREDYRRMVAESAELTEFYENSYKSLLEKDFTVRKCWAWQAGNRRREGYWDWLQDSPQAPGTDFDGNPEQIAVAMGVHAHTSRGRSLRNGDSNYNPEGNYGFSLGTARYGYHFAEQFDYALTQDVDVVMITGWNEWYAGVHVAGQNQTCGQTPTPGYYMVDQMSPEYSRDGEPMRIRDGENSVGFGDNYYYQMVSYIRKFKGLNAPAATVNGGSLPTADTALWAGVAPLFTDTVGDVDLRSQESFCAEFLYVNGTARNDLATAQVSQDGEHLYFHVTTATPLITVDDELWMNLYIDADNDPTTGWEGFDYLINRSRTDRTVSVERFVDGKWVFETVGEGEYVLSESAMTVKVQKATLGISDGESVALHFKWADNADVRGDVMRFMELGDTAPNDRFVFAYTSASASDQRVETPAATEAPATAPADPPATSPAAPETSAPAETEAPGKKGCRSLVGGAALLPAAALTALTLRRGKGRDRGRRGR